MKIQDCLPERDVYARTIDSAQSAAMTMEKYDMASLPVFNGIRAVGVVTDRHIALSCGKPEKPGKKILVSEIMHKTNLTCPDNLEILEVYKSMEANHMAYLLVSDYTGKIIGSLTVEDIAGAMTSFLSGNRKN